MAVKDKILLWFLQNVILRGVEILDHPGFVVSKFDQSGTSVFYRDIFLPESLVMLIEDKVCERYESKGKQALYSAGKKFGYNFASISKIPTVKNSKEKELLDGIYFLVRFVEAVYATSADYIIDLKNSSIEFRFTGYVICARNGKGQLFTDGGISGIWAHVMQDSNIDGVQTSCQGRGNNECRVVCSPSEKLTDDHFSEKNLFQNIADERYLTLNKIRDAHFSNRSLKQLIDVKFFDYKPGNLKYSGERFFYVESSIIPILEKEILSLPDGEKFLFDVCFEYGEKFGSMVSFQNYSQFITDFFSALGYGDIQCSKKEEKIYLFSYFYPFSESLAESKFVLIRGWISGVLTSITKRRVILSEFYTDYSQNYLSLRLQES